MLLLERLCQQTMSEGYVSISLNSQLSKFVLVLPHKPLQYFQAKLLIVSSSRSCMVHQQLAQSCDLSSLLHGKFAKRTVKIKNINILTGWLFINILWNNNFVGFSLLFLFQCQGVPMAQTAVLHLLRSLYVRVPTVEH